MDNFLAERKQWMSDLTKLSAEQQSNVNSRCTAQGITMSRSALTQLFSDSELLKDKEVEFCDSIFLDIAKTIFGIVPENIERNLILATFHAICERYFGITIKDIALAFKTHIQRDKVFTLTRDIFIEPIEEFWHKKMIVKREVEIEMRQIHLHELSLREKESAYIEARQIYLDSRGCGEYQGTLFQASMIMENFIHLFTDEEKILIAKRAINKYNESKLKRDNSINTQAGLLIPVPEPKEGEVYVNGKVKPVYHYFLAMEVVNECLRKPHPSGCGLQFIEI
jgi:hypothetical protein